MDPTELNQGSAYYRLTFADRAWTIPGVEPMVFVGTNVLDSQKNSSEPFYCFQDTVSFHRFGDATKYRGSVNLAEEGASIHSFTQQELLSDLFTLNGLITELHATQARANGGNKK